MTHPRRGISRFWLSAFGGARRTTTARFQTRGKHREVAQSLPLRASQSDDQKRYQRCGLKHEMNPAGHRTSERITNRRSHTPAGFARQRPDGMSLKTLDPLPSRADTPPVNCATQVSAGWQTQKRSASVGALKRPAPLLRQIFVICYGFGAALAAAFLIAGSGSKDRMRTRFNPEIVFEEECAIAVIFLRSHGPSEVMASKPRSLSKHNA
jgi:hypothetical protein